jgi:menaquinone-specific isochorismate synthase
MSDGRILHVDRDFRSGLAHAVSKASLRARNGAAPAFRRVIVRVPLIDPLLWLASQTHEDRFYWSGRSHQDAVAGVGRVDAVEGDSMYDIDRIRQKVNRILSSASAGVRLFGGIRFDGASSSDPEWVDFPAYRFVLPRFELHTRGQDSLLVCNIRSDEPTSNAVLQSEIEALLEPVPDLPGIPGTVSRSDFPGRRDWIRDIDWALEAFSSTTLAKVVLARMARFEFESEVSPFTLMHRLRLEAPSCYHFLFGHGESCFLGATPERLFRLEGRRIESEAVAGTGPRGATDGDDQVLCDELLHSEKDQREHEYVRQSIKEALTDLTRMLHVDTTASDMKLAVGRHLVSGVEGVLRDDVDTFRLLESLHPTPAVGGYPHQEAIDVIEHLESFDRGWYSGPVGWIGADSAEFAVGIRSGRLRGRCLDLFSGAGIVCGSDPAREWDEVEQKIGDFLRVIEP